MLKELDGGCYIADPKVYADKDAEKRHGDGKLYRVESENVRVDESKLRNAVISHAVQVLITNLPFSADLTTREKKQAPTMSSICTSNSTKSKQDSR